MYSQAKICLKDISLHMLPIGQLQQIVVERRSECIFELQSKTLNPICPSGRHGDYESEKL
jgi:hypothetical protein